VYGQTSKAAVRAIRCWSTARLSAIPQPCVSHNGSHCRRVLPPPTSTVMCCQRTSRKRLTNAASENNRPPCGTPRLTGVEDFTLPVLLTRWDAGDARPCSLGCCCRMRRWLLVLQPDAYADAGPAADAGSRVTHDFGGMGDEVCPTKDQGARRLQVSRVDQNMAQVERTCSPGKRRQY
jgi:hypothetical protein